MGRTVTASREALAEELERIAEGWLHLGNDARAFEAMDAWEQVQNGADVVRAGHTEYRVEE